MSQARILIAGVGNIFLGDDAFGVEVVQALARRPLPEGVEVVDFGIRGLDLAYALLKEYDAVILVDTSPRGGSPGTLYVLEPECSTGPAPEDASLAIETHSLDPAKVLRLAAALGGQVKKLLLVACEPEPLQDPDDMRMGLSSPVQAVVSEAITVVESLVARLLGGEGNALSCGVQEQ
jgi:hydrogenase maturation protease